MFYPVLHAEKYILPPDLKKQADKYPHLLQSVTWQVWEVHKSHHSSFTSQWCRKFLKRIPLFPSTTALCSPTKSVILPLHFKSFVRSIFTNYVTANSTAYVQVSQLLPWNEARNPGALWIEVIFHLKDLPRKTCTCCCVKKLLLIQQWIQGNRGLSKKR